MIYIVTGVRETNVDGWTGAISLPTFYVEAVSPREAATKAAEILSSGTPGAVNCAAVEHGNAAAEVHEFVAFGGIALALRPIG